MNAIEVRDLTKRFGAFVAVNRVSFDVRAGEIFGFLGSNGAGKSTTIRMLCGLLKPTSGQATVGGVDVVRDPEGVKRRIGYMSQRFSLYEALTVDQNIEFFGGVYGVSAERMAARRAMVLEMAGLQGRERSLTRTLAAGWRQRLALGCAILHEPSIVFLDEPTGGVDPLSRRRFWRPIHELSRAGVAVLLSHCFYLRYMGGGGRLAGTSQDPPAAPARPRIHCALESGLAARAQDRSGGAVVADARGQTLSIEVFEQWHRVLPREPGQFFEVGHAHDIAV